MHTLNDSARKFFEGNNMSCLGFLRFDYHTISLKKYLHALFIENQLHTQHVQINRDLIIKT